MDFVRVVADSISIFSCKEAGVKVELLRAKQDCRLILVPVHQQGLAVAQRLSYS